MRLPRFECIAPKVLLLPGSSCGGFIRNGSRGALAQTRNDSLGVPSQISTSGFGPSSIRGLTSGCIHRHRSKMYCSDLLPEIEDFNLDGSSESSVFH